MWVGCSFPLFEVFLGTGSIQISKPLLYSGLLQNCFFLTTRSAGYFDGSQTQNLRKSRKFLTSFQSKTCVFFPTFLTSELRNFIRCLSSFEVFSDGRQRFVQ